MSDLLHAATADREDNRFREGLSALSEGSFDTHACALLISCLTRRRQSTSGIGRPRVEVEIVFGLLDGAG